MTVSEWVATRTLDPSMAPLGDGPNATNPLLDTACGREEKDREIKDGRKRKKEKERKRNKEKEGERGNKEKEERKRKKERKKERREIKKE